MPRDPAWRRGTGPPPDSADLHRPDANQDRKVWIAGFVGARRQLFARQSEAECGVQQRVAEAGRPDRRHRKHLSEQASGPCLGQPPVVRVGPVLETYTARARHRHEKDAVVLQQSVAFPNDGGHLVDDVQRLGEDDAVVGGGRDMVEPTQISNHRRPRVGDVEVQNIAPLDPLTSEPSGVFVFLYFEHGSTDVACVCREIALDDWPIRRRAALVAPVVREGCRARKRTKIDGGLPVGRHLGERFSAPPAETLDFRFGTVQPRPIALVAEIFAGSPCSPCVPAARWAKRRRASRCRSNSAWTAGRYSPVNQLRRYSARAWTRLRSNGARSATSAPAADQAQPEIGVFEGGHRFVETCARLPERPPEQGGHVNRYRVGEDVERRACQDPR